MANEAESGLELVLDNRKLIIVFGLLIAVCVCAFVLGFIEGKRQGFQEGNQAAGETLRKAMPETNLTQADKPVQATEETASPKPDPASQPLDWYQNINKRGGASGTPPPAAEPKAQTAPPAKPAAIPAAKPNSQPAAEPAVSYSVQVGAFKNKQQMDATARLLREKGFDVRTVEPEDPGGLYRLKVGKFRTRAEAAAMRLRLQKHGFAPIIKTN